MDVNPDIDDEVGLTEDEIKKIIGDDNLAMDSSGLEEITEPLSDDVSSDSERLQNNYDSHNSSIDQLIEEVDLTGLNEEVGTIDLDADDSKEEDLKNDMDTVEDVDFSDVLLSEPSIALKQESALPVVPVKTGEKIEKSAKKPPSKLLKKTPANKPKISKPTLKKKSVKKTSSQNRKVKTVMARSSSIPVWKDTQKMKALFKHLDEMLTYLPPERIKNFALSQEYETYFSILKKLGI